MDPKIALLVFYLIFLLPIYGDLRKKLKGFEIINTARKRINKRDLLENGRSVVEIELSEKTYKLHLEPAKGLIDSKFRAILRHPDGGEEIENIGVDELFHGRVEGCLRSWVRLVHSPGNGLFGAFSCDIEQIYLEPHFLHNATAPDDEMIVYRASDVIPATNLVRSADDQVFIFPETHQPVVEIPKSRKRRYREVVVEKNRCPMKIIADYSFFNRAGNNHLAFTSRYIVNLFDRVNQIYTKTDFGENSSQERLVNLGFMIKEIVIFAHWTADPKDPEHYNTDKEFNAYDFLQSLKRLEDSEDYCLVHLLTARTFREGILGLAFVGTSATGAGICPQSRQSYNTLFSTVAASGGGQLLVTREADIVTAHELGHSWGAKHDNGTECQPKSLRDGNYIMHPTAVPGYDVNNMRFSQCSIRDMRQVLSNRADDCFIPHQRAVCGNGILEDGEMCDEGFIVHGQSEGRCCSRECQLLAGSQCSPKNHPCCSPACTFLPPLHICRFANALQCTRQSNCTGTNGDCPPPRPTLDGTNCVDKGQCQNGTCLPFCETIGKESCICLDDASACMRCCRSPNSTECLPEPNGGMLRDGTFCVHGTCQNNKCKSSAVDVVSHFWHVFEGVDSSNWKLFFKSNIAVIIVVISLFVWIPASFVVCLWDTGDPDKNKIRRVGQVNWSSSLK